MTRSTAADSPERPGAGTAGIDHHFRTIAELAGDIAFSIDLPASTLRYLSPAFSALLGHEAGALQAAIAGGGAQEALGALGMHLASQGALAPGERREQEVDVRNADGHPVGLIAVAADRLIAMLDEYLSPDRMAAIGKVRQPNTIAARELLDAGVKQLREAGREAVVDAEELKLGLRGEPEGLRLALKVLVDNALLYSPAGSKVTLGARRSGSGVEFTVSDEGAGVPPEDAACIFDKGYRGSNATGLPCSGLGLYMARSIVDVHGGMLRLTEDGKEFRLWLPALDISGQQRLASSSPSSDNRTDH